MNLTQIIEEALRYGIDTPAQVAAFAATIDYESGGFKHLRENMNYSVEGLMKTFVKWGRMTLDEAVQYGRYGQRQRADQVAIANIVYANRMGNGDRHSGDGWAYRGGGYIQLTGRAAYRDIGRRIGVDLEAHPEKIEASPDVALKASLQYWKDHDLNRILEAHGFDAVQGVVNTGSRRKVATGLEGRRALFDKYLNSITE